MTDRDAVPTLHIYAQSAWHDPAHVVGNRKALIALRKAIDEALHAGKGTADAFASDGEGYGIVVRCVDGQSHDKAWIRRALPYTADYAEEERPDAVWPWDETT